MKSAPFNKLTIWPIPKVIELTIIALFTLLFAIILKRKPRKIISSIKPTLSIVNICNTISLEVLLVLKPFHRLTDTISSSGIKYKYPYKFVTPVNP